VPAQWLSQAGDLSTRVGAALGPLGHALSRPAWQRRIRMALIVLLSLWAVLSLARLVWSLLPRPEPAGPLSAPVLNPVSRQAAAVASRELDIERMRGWRLFGEAGAVAVAQTPQPVASVLDGIEKDARETRLDLKLRGVVASTEEGLGHAIIEHRGKQAVYAVDDDLPVPGRVKLAKVMPTQVILDNGGTYERLVLFEESPVATPLAPPAASRTAREVDKRGEADVSALASDYRARLYTSPQSLAEVVNVSAVRRDGGLLGYRVTPGRNPEHFEQLGFQPGDLVTGVNGIALDSPANTMRLYNAMRSAGEVVFEVQRGDQPLSIAVSLDSNNGP